MRGLAAFLPASFALRIRSLPPRATHQKIRQASLIPSFGVGASVPCFSGAATFGALRLEQGQRARLLRDRYGYTGEVRAIGDVLRDQLFFMQRCGFDAFVIREDRSAEDALQSLKDFSETYQAATDQPQPLFRRRQA